MEPHGSADDTGAATRTRAFGRLVEYGSKARFRTALQTAVNEFWSPAFRKRPQREQDLAYARAEAAAGMATYCLLDAPALFGTTIAEQFLAEQGSHLTRTESAYLQRLASTRMGLYRIDEVRLDDGLTCTDLWTNERVEIREKRMTHDMVPGYVVAARAFPDADVGTVFDGAIYLFDAPDARKVVKALRAELKSARNVDPSVSEQQFLKRRFAVIINRLWFDCIFWYDDAPATQQSHLSSIAEHREQRDHALVDFDIQDPVSQRLAEFLCSAAAPTAMSIDRLHGFLCAIICARRPQGPFAWLPLIWGDQEPKFASQVEAERVIGDVFAFSNGVAQTIADKTFQPLLPRSARPGTLTIAERWCAGFVEGMMLDQRSWKQLLDNDQAKTLMEPIFMLAAPASSSLVAKVDPSELMGLIKLLPEVIKIIAEMRTAPKARKARTVQRQRSESKAPNSTEADASASLHRLKITLNGVRPSVWRRVEIASDAKLPFVSRVLIESMGWDNTHLHAFRCGGKSYGIPDPDFPSGMRNERSVSLADIAPNVKSRFFFDYDFGDGWEHTVVVEAIGTVAESSAPRCIAGARACPPEDCGGVPGLAELRKILADPSDDDYANMREWAGYDFDFEQFDLGKVNRNLQRLVRKRRAPVRRSR